MEENIVVKKSMNIKVSPEILSNKELSINEKLILSLDYTYNSKKGYNSLTHIDIGKLFRLHPNIVWSCRKKLIKKRFIVKDEKDITKHILTDKLKSVELPVINGKIDKREIIIPFEIYNHLYLHTGAKLLFGEYNSLSKTEKGYFSKRDTTSKRMNVSIGSVTNWTKELDLYGLLEEYTINSSYRTKQKVVRTKDLKKKTDNNDEYLHD